MKSSAMNICVREFVGIPVLNSFGYKSRSEIAGSYGDSIMSNFLRNCKKHSFQCLLSTSTSTGGGINYPGAIAPNRISFL